MSKIAFVFPGQGTQYIGMGKDFYESFSICKEVFHKASDESGIDIPKLCFEESEKINVTEYTQIAILTVEAAILAVINEKGIISTTSAGLSLGEYGALIASDTLCVEDAFWIVRKRGLYMQEAMPVGGAMAAVIGAAQHTVEGICEKSEGIVSIANYNCPGQIVITGHTEAVKRAGELLKEKGAKRILPLNVSGPFHSELLYEAGKRLEKVLKTIDIREPVKPYISNVTADYVTKKEDIKQLLVKQVSSPVRWQQSVERMLEDGVDTFIEIGPGKTLTGFLRKINKNAKAINLGVVEDLEKL